AGMFAACTTEETVTPTNAPSNLMALSKSPTSISIKWTRASGDASADTVYANSGALTPIILATSSTATTMDLTGLAANLPYTITVHGGGGSSNTIIWSGATRTGPLT